MEGRDEPNSTLPSPFTFSTQYLMDNLCVTTCDGLQGSWVAEFTSLATACWYIHGVKAYLFRYYAYT